MEIRVKFGMNPYSNEFTCSYCGRGFKGGGFFIRLEYSEIIVDIPICPRCYRSEMLFEGVVALDAHHACHPIGRA